MLSFLFNHDNIHNGCAQLKILLIMTRAQNAAVNGAGPRPFMLAVNGAGRVLRRP